MASHGHGCNIPRVSVFGIRIFPKFCFFRHNFGCRYAKKIIKGSKDTDDGLESKKLFNQKWPFGSEPRAR